MPDVVFAAPIAFTIGVGVGLALCSRYRIVRVKDRSDDPPDPPPT